MAQCHECDAIKEYQGNRSQRNYTFDFEYYETSEINVSIYNSETQEWEKQTVNVDWRLANPTTISLAEPTEEKIRIYRCTDLHPMRAVFQPGTAIKAKDLNDDFDQLRNAIEEVGCLGEKNSDRLDDGYTLWLNRIEAGTTDPEIGLEGDLVKSKSDLIIDDDHVATTQWIDNRYWDQCDETTYSYDTWVDELDDVHVPTTAAVEQRLASLQLLTGVQKVTESMQENQQWNSSVTDDDHVATTGALVKRYDTRLADLGSTITRLDDPTKYVQPGKFWVDTNTIRLFYQDPSQNWVQINTMGDPGVQGEQGEQGPPGLSGHIGDEPPTDKYPGQLWFNTKCPSGLYVWDGTQWIGVSIPGPQGPQGEKGAGMDAADLTAIKPIVATIDVAAQSAEISMNIDLLPPI